MIGDIVTSITDKELKKDYFYNAVPLAVILGKDAKEGTLWAAFASYAPGCKMIEVAAICDNTILGSGKKGILFSTEGIYGSMFNKNRKQGPIAMPIKYEELDSARPSPRDKSEVELVFKGGRVEKIYVYTYTGFVITALNRILEELKREKEREKEEKNPLVADPAHHAAGHRADLRRCAGRCLRRHHGVCAQSRVHLRGHGAESAGLQPALRHHGSPDLRQPENRRTGARLH